MRTALKARLWIDFGRGALSTPKLALAGQGDFEGATREFTLALKMQPDDANVEANLGAALAEMGKFAEAKAHFERALQIDPEQPIAKENLEALRKEMGAH